MKNSQTSVQRPSSLQPRGVYAPHMKRKQRCGVFMRVYSLRHRRKQYSDTSTTPSTPSDLL